MEVRSKRLAPPAGDRPFFQGTADQVVADIRAYAAAGVTHFVFDHTHQDLRALLENLERFAHEVRPKLEARRASEPKARAVGRSVVAGAARSGKGAGGLTRGARGSARRSKGRQAARASNRRRKGSR
jgi:hypothetical protein